MKLAVGCDHAGFNLKETVVKYLRIMGHEVTDCGTNSTVSCDYPDYAAKVCKEIVEGRAERGILICGTGIGMSIAANKVPGAYAALVNNIYQAQRAQLSNNANIITMGAQVMGIEVAKMCVDEYLRCTFDPKSRSLPKVQRILDYEKEVTK